MTREEREEAIKVLKEYEDGLEREEREKAIDLLDNLVGMIEDNQGNDYDFALKKGIEALKEEPVIDKIRAEMFEEMLSHSGTGEEVIQAYVDGLMKGLDILDKCKAESEE